MSDQLAEIREIVGRLDERTLAIHEDVVGVAGRLDSHSRRLGSLERYRAWLTGWATAMTVTVATAATGAWHWFGGRGP